MEVTENEPLPTSAFAIGKNRGGESIFVGRALIDHYGRESIQVGQINSGNQVMGIPFDGKQLLQSPPYEILCKINHFGGESKFWENFSKFPILIGKVFL